MIIDSIVIAAIIGGAVSLIAALVSIIFSMKSYHQAKQNQYAQAEKDASDAYDRMVNFRTSHPEVFKLAWNWKRGYFQKVYAQNNPNDKEWVYYYTYVELCLGYCNIVLSARSRRVISEIDFNDRHRRLVKLLLTENNPILEDLLVEDKYISEYIKKFRSEEIGWKWKDEHNKLCS